MTRDICIIQVLEPNCQIARPRTKGAQGRRTLDEEDLQDLNISGLNKSAYWCRSYYYVLSDIWANNKRVREALHVREGTTGVWTRCNFSVAYTKSVTSTIDYHKYFSKQNLRALVYSGDHDMNIPHIATQNWDSYAQLEHQ
ncbi:serine carboxypeptidase, putative [Ricinus communis]|uniref:Serine carboxypeptidase, putative n=1 Tax=Ricinus communis TaxID=3988 RepID=B9TB11_RICCO|nr:serine carboxypeptidase, putative [Ricinus communis]